MPITAKLSRRFYEQFGDEATNELVDWLNAVDALYRNELKDVNEHNFARFDAKLEQRAAGIEAKIDGLEARIDARIDGVAARIDGLEAKVDVKIDALEARVGQRFQLVTADIDRRFAEERTYLSTSLGAFESRLTRWMFTLWTGTMLALAGMLLAILKLK